MSKPRLVRRVCGVLLLSLIIQCGLLAMSGAALLSMWPRTLPLPLGDGRAFRNSDGSVRWWMMGSTPIAGGLGGRVYVWENIGPVPVPANGSPAVQTYALPESFAGATSVVEIRLGLPVPFLVGTVADGRVIDGLRPDGIAEPANGYPPVWPTRIQFAPLAVSLSLCVVVACAIQGAGRATRWWRGRRSERPCPTCGYELVGVRSADGEVRCPECGGIVAN